MIAGEWESQPFGVLSDGRPVRRFIATLENGASVSVTDLGASLLSLTCPDRQGRLDDVVLGCADARSHWAQSSYLGATVGRVAGRIGGAAFELDGRHYPLSANEGANHLHGGHKGFSRRLWHADIISGPSPAIRFALFSADGEEGYPGNLWAQITYRFEPPARLTLLFEARSDGPTPFNPTSHGYFNLNGHAAGPIDDHRLLLRADRFTQLGAGNIPTGEILPVESSMFDFTRLEALDRNRARMPAGYDHNFLIRGADGAMREAARLYSPTSGRSLTVSTDRPCIHLYTGGMLGSIEGKDDARYGPFSGLCLETQGFPDAPNHAAFAKVWLRPGETFSSKTVFDFSTDEGG